jgi:hypothetical protein
MNTYYDSIFNFYISKVNNSNAITLNIVKVDLQ